MLLFSCFFSFLVFCTVCIFSLKASYKCPIVLYECVLIYLWFAKMKIWSMLQVLSQENEKKKKNTMNDSLCICVMGKVGLFGGISGSKASRL